MPTLTLFTLTVMLPNVTAGTENATDWTCTACECESDRLACTTPDTLDATPLAPVPEGVTEMEIRDQRDLVTLDDGVLSAYTNLEKLILTDSGLRSLGNDTFAGNLLLRHLELRGNPLECVCSNSWILQRNTRRQGSFQGRAVEGGKTCQILDSICAVPEVKVHPEVISVKEGEAFEVNCSAVGKPVPQLAWIWGVEDAKRKAEENLVGESLTIRIPSARWKDHGQNLTCVATNDAGRSQAHLTLNIS
ncbi:unnamed protein product, partial [Darwinula stevensoni]